MKKVAGSLRTDLAQYRELEAFSKFGTDLDKITLRTLAKGERLVELLKQGQYSPLPVERQVVSVYLGTNGYLDSVPVHDVKRFEKEILEFIEVKHDNIFESIRNDKDINEEIINEIKKAVEEFLAVFKKTS